LHPRSDRDPHPLTDDQRTSERPPTSGRQPGILDLQRQAGNSAVGRMLRHGSSPKPDALRDRLGAGHPLPGGLKARMESAYRADLSDARIHTGSEAARFASEERAQALTVGQDIAFGSGAFRPGTPVGDALIGHELAHVVQQQKAETLVAPAGRRGAGTSSLERDANRSAFAAMAGLWATTTGAFAHAARDARPRLRSAMQVLRAGDCVGTEQQFQAPSYLGRHSIEALEDINRIVESTDLLGKFIVYGTAATLVTSTPAETLVTGGYDVSPQAEALRAIPTIRRARINDRIDYLLLEHENDMNPDERRFWQRVRAAVNQSVRSPAGVAR
jgi:hypothetical protein